MRGQRAVRPAPARGIPRLAAGICLVLAVVVAGCSGPILARSPASRAAGPSPTPGRSPAIDPQPIRFPQDDGAHDRLTEWWYYTGHLVDGTGARYGFEFVIFRAERGRFPVTWASHVALTDERGQSFHYAQRSEFGPQVDVSARVSSGPTSFALAISGSDPSRPTAGPAPWVMRGYAGTDRLAASLSPDEAVAAGSPGGLGFALDLEATKPPALHDGDGWIDFGPGGGSYYYSRTSMVASGSLTLDGRTVAVSGSAWFDHQWGDFISVGGGGWDWFALNLSDGTDLTLSLVRSRDGSYPLVYGTLVDRDGRTRHLDGSEFSVNVTGRWTSPRTGAVYPAGWIVEVPADSLTVELTPAVAAQELDTRATTGVVYWEGSQVVRARRAGTALDGEAYVELTGYGPP
jgi:predicted secreted hydrolase